MKDWLGGSYIVLEITPRVPGGRPLMYIGYMYNSRKVLGFIATEGSGSTEPGDPYLSHFPGIYFSVSVHPAVRPHFIGRYFNEFNTIYNKKRIRQYDLALEKYWVKQSGYFRLATTVTLGVGITDRKLLLCHGISDKA